MIFISTILVTSRLASHTEIIAILSSGVSLIRLLWTYMMGAIVVAILTFAMIGWIIPKANKTRVEFELEYLEGSIKSKKNNHLQIAPGVYSYASNFSKHTTTAHGFTLERFEDKNLVERLKADHAVYDSTRSSWRVRRYTVRKLIDTNEVVVHGSSMDTVLNLYPRDFKYSYKEFETLTLSELDRQIEEMKFRGLAGVEEYIGQKYERITYPFAIIVLTAIGVIVSARKSRQGVGGQIVLGILLALVYILFLLVGRNFTQSDFMHPLFNAWLPNIIFSVIGVILYRTIPK